MTMDARELELLAAAAICDAGISLPLEVAFRRRPVRVTMRIPVTWSLVRVSRLYLKMGVTPEEYDGYTSDQRIRFIARHGRDVCRIVAAGVVRGPLLGRVLNRPVAWLLGQTMHPAALAEAWRLMLTTMSTTSFGSIITSAAALNKMQPLVSRNESGSDARS